MPSPLTVVKSVGPKLVPFFKTVTLFFILYGGGDSKPGFIYVVFKCLPIISLIFFVLLHGMNFSEVYYYSRRVLIGLIFSCIGDIGMAYKDHGYFLPAIGMFAMAQVMYATAFGFRPFRPYHGLVVFGIGLTLLSCILPNIAYGPLPVFGVIYCLLICLMLWRAVARVQLFDDLWTWTKLCSCVGAILFIISDSVIAIDKFHTKIPFAQNIIMTTYYAAQLGITLSVVDSQVDALLEGKKTN
ncbi:lysoplasmalogenase TMEM86A-like [Lineus longissimus]|uniref:lysoplasmalogenase TMEM86A-like n=1 Tax=Lineus longissimus TaxID=88925 RepID=UPI002B4D75F6